ncbi:UPF0481 protein At3g47200-like isoform X4 [Trifolium pratense]|uniref:UPF0481 protein At3g47200-like isoform X4 n=1 Tax=Trifolium pratense TaxID=57577 RepID=UPI001E693A29|nr:UPF0481 protein At3g47200-like isoform X4 [Trifolium pratense]
MASQITLEQNFMKLQNSKPAPHSSRPKIQRVAEYLRTRENFEKHYTPKLVSIGPIHHGNENLKLGEKYKLMWAAQYIKNGRLDPHNLHKKIADNIVELKGLFADDVLALTGTRESLEGFTSLEEKLSWMLFVDGCSPLHILEHADLRKPEAMNIKVDQLILVMMDVILLENQLPYPVLKLLWKNDNEAELKETMKEFLKFHHWDTADNRQIWRSRIQGHWLSIQNESVSESPVHLLDLQRKIFFTKSSSKTEANKKNQGTNSREPVTYRNIQDLKAAGIKLEPSATRRPTDIDFFDGWFAAKLTLSEMVADESTIAIFLNLTAYEMCPDFENDYGVCSFVAFIDSLIDCPEDVRELRSKGILHHCLSSDEEVANIFNLIGKDLVDNTEIYFDVRDKINKHCCNKYKTLIGLGINTYFNNPWACIAFLAAFIALILTFVQTWFTIYPANK